MSNSVQLDHHNYWPHGIPSDIQLSEEHFDSVFLIKIDSVFAKVRTLYFGTMYCIVVTPDIAEDIGKESIAGKLLHVKEVNEGPLVYGKRYKFIVQDQESLCSLCDCELPIMSHLYDIPTGCYKINYDHNYIDGSTYINNGKVQCQSYDRYLEIADIRGWSYSFFVPPRMNFSLTQDSLAGKEFVKNVTNSIIFL